MFKPKKQFDISVCQSLGKAKKKSGKTFVLFFAICGKMPKLLGF